MSHLLSLILTTSCCCVLLPIAHSFTIHPFFAKPTTSSTIITAPSSSSTVLHLKKGGKFGKQKDLAAKMEAAKRQRQQLSTSATTTTTSTDDQLQEEALLSPEEIKLRNDRKRFESLLENSIISNNNDNDNNDYLTEAQEEENADAAYRGISRLYEGDPAPSSPFAELRSISNGEPIGSSGVLRYVPWEGGSSKEDYIVVLSDPRPKSIELRCAIRNLLTSASVSKDILSRIIIINPDSPGENRKQLKKYQNSNNLTVLIDEDLEWMREYTALGEKRFSMTLFVLSGGVCRRIAREVDGDLICGVVGNAVKGL